MGTIPELDGNLFPSSSGWMPEGRSATETSGTRREGVPPSSTQFPRRMGLSSRTLWDGCS